MRTRQIKPGFWTNEHLAECSPLARLLFIALWCIADREGRLEDRPSRIRAQCLPFEQCDVNGLLNELQSRGFITRYEVDGERYIAIDKFKQHQQLHPGEAASKLPPCNSMTSPVINGVAVKLREEQRNFDSSSVPSCLLSSEPSSAPHTPQRGEGPGPKDFLETWNAARGLTPVRKLTEKRLRQLRLRGTDPDWCASWRDALARAATPPFCLGQNERGWRADVDWFLRPDTVTRILEGKYDGLGKGQTAPAMDKTTEDIARQTLERRERSVREAAEAAASRSARKD